MDDGLGGDYVALTPDRKNTVETVRLIKNLVKGRLYRFTYRIMNANGWSDLSNPIYIRAAVAPSKPNAPTLIQATASQF